MESFLIRDADAAASLEFYDRSPADPRKPFVTFWVRLTGPGLSATRRVDSLVGYDSSPAHLFVEMAERWKGWPGELEWSPLDAGIRLSCSQDRAGHVAIRVELQRGPGDRDWSVESTVMAEAGQLEEIAVRAVAFFGPRASEPVAVPSMP